MTNSVGVIGLGIMGGAMSANLVEAGFRVAGYDIDGAACERLAAKGGEVVDSPGAVAKLADIVITSLPSPAALDAVVNDADGLVAPGRTGLTVIETSTFTIEDKQRAHDALADAGIVLLDCPLSGTGAQAITKDLLVYASGDRAAFERCVPVLEGFARGHHYVGEFGAGSKMKYVANLLVAIHNVASAEAMVLGMKAGLDPQVIYDVIAGGAGGSRIFELRGPMMVADDYEPATMRMEIWQKDMKVIGEFASALKSPTPLFATSAEIYKIGMAQGRAKQDTASVCGVLEDLGRHRRGKG
ncbi:MAG: NAD(P)-dependent oxidoreductase [Rhodospirillales bacterium]|nr:MAG: NAD(P)-dependent oxidoreductase [Rhodospirillales bacterium]